MAHDFYISCGVFSVIEDLTGVKDAAVMVAMTEASNRKFIRQTSQWRRVRPHLRRG